MTVSIRAMPYAEMGIPVKAVYHNLAEHSPYCSSISHVGDIEWSDGDISPGVRHCGCAFLVTDGDQKILVDCGMGPFEKIKAIRMEHGDKFYLKPLDPVEVQLARLGIEPSDIDVVVNTHLHWDHCGGNLSFPGARFYLPEGDLPYALNAPKWAPHFFAGMRDCVTGIMDRAVMVAGDMQLTEHTRIVHLGGHTPGSQGVLVQTKRGVIALAGDVVCKYENLENDWIGPSGNIWDVSGLVDAVARLRKMCGEIIPSHDWKLFERYADGVIA